MSIGIQSAFGTIAPAAGARRMPRVNSAPVFSRDSFASNTIELSQQVKSARLGVKRGQIPYQGQLTPGTYPEFFRGLLRKDWVAGVSVTATTISATYVAGTSLTFTRPAGSFITDGFRVGDVIRATGFTNAAAVMNNRNYRIVNMTATTLVTSGTGNETGVTAAAGDSVTLKVQGKKVMVPTNETGDPHLFSAFSWEDYFADLNKAEVYVGCRMQQLRLSFPPTGYVMFDAMMQAKDMVKYDTGPYFTSPAAPPAIQGLAGVNGIVRMNNGDVVTMTGLQLAISCQSESNPCIGADTVPEIFQGVISVSGSGSLYLGDMVNRDNYLGETEGEMHLFMTSDGTLNSPFMTAIMPRVKMMGVQKSDSPLSVMQSITFQALEGTGTNNRDRSTIIFQDSELT